MPRPIATDPAADMPSRRRWTGLLRWSLAALAVTVAHGGAAWIVSGLPPAHAEAAAGAPEPAIMIELAALSVAQEAPATAEPIASEPMAPEAQPEPDVAETPDPSPAQAEGPAPEKPTLPERPVADAVSVPSPPPRRPTASRPEIAPKPPAPPRVVVRKPDRRPARAAAAPPPSAPRAVAPSPQTNGTAAAPSAAAANWRGSLLVHLNRYKRFPDGGRPGTVQVAFAIDRSGRVLSARLSGSSGNPALDEEAVAMVRRASPVPAPPSGLGGATIALAVPVRFAR